MTLAQHSPRPRFGPRPETPEDDDSAVREFDFSSEAPTRPVQMPELDLQLMVDSGEYPLGWSKNPTIPSPPTLDDLALCGGERPTPILPIDERSAPAFLPKSFPAVALRDPGPPEWVHEAFPPNERPTTPARPALSQRPTAVPPHTPLSPRFSLEDFEAPAWPDEGTSRPVLRSPELPPRAKRPSDPFRPPQAAPPAGAMPLRKASPPPTKQLGMRRAVEETVPSPRAAREISQRPSGSREVRSRSERVGNGRIKVLMSTEELLSLPLDHKAGFILSMLGTVSTLDELLDISGMPKNDAMRLLCDLADLGAIDLG